MQCASMEEESPGWSSSAVGRRETRGWASQRNVEALEFACVEGISRMRYSEARSLLRVAGVDTRVIRDISFVGGSVCSPLTEKARKGELVKILTFEGSPLKALENFDPMSKEHFERGIPPSQIISPIDVFIKRAASAVAKTVGWRLPRSISINTS